MSFTQKQPKVVLQHFNVTYLNPFNTLRSCKIRLFKRQNRGMVIGDTCHHEITTTTPGERSLLPLKFSKVTSTV